MFVWCLQLRTGIAIHFEIFVRGVFISVDLHVGDVTLFGWNRLVDLLGKRRVNTRLVQREVQGNDWTVQTVNQSKRTENKSRAIVEDNRRDQKYAHFLKILFHSVYFYFLSVYSNQKGTKLSQNYGQKLVDCDLILSSIRLQLSFIPKWKWNVYSWCSL